MVLKGKLDLKSLIGNTVNARQKNEKLLFKTLKAGEKTEFGKLHHFDEVKTVEDYRRNVPLSTYEDYAPYIDRMINNNEEDLLISYPLIGYSQTSGSTGKPKFIPLTQKIASTYQKYTLTNMMALTDEYCRKQFGRPLKPGRGIFICVDFDEKLPNGRSASNVPETTSKQLGFLYPYLLNPPFKKLFRNKDVAPYYIMLRFALEDRNTMYIFSVFFSVIYELLSYMRTNWEIFVNDIENGTISDLARATPEIREELMKVIKPNPERAAELRKEFEKGFDETILQRIWPNLSVIYGIASSVYTIYANNVRKIAGDVPFDYSIYGASEGLLGAPFQLNIEDRVLVIDSCYYEFIPEDDESKILSIDELEIGKEYELVITNQAGLYRYRMGDIVQVKDYINQCPNIIFTRRKGHMISICGEKTTENDMQVIIRELQEAAGCTILNWILYVNHDTRPSHYTLLIENEEGKDLRGYAGLVDQTLQRINPLYERFIRNRGISPATIANQKSGTHAEWRDLLVRKGVAPTQVKPVRVLDNNEKIDFFLSRIADADSSDV
jgi:hypothetical protein